MVHRIGPDETKRGWFWSAGVLLVLSACSGTDRAPAAVPAESRDAAMLGEVFENVAEACPTYRVSAAPPSDGSDQLFIEAVVIDAPLELAEQVSLSTLPDLAQSPRVKLVASPHVIGTFGATAEMVLGLPSEPSTPTLYRWSMLPRHTDTDVSSLELELELNEPGAAADAIRKPVRFSVTTRDNEPRLAHVAWHPTERRSLLVLFRTFRIQGEQDLRAIFECKMQQRARYVERLRAKSSTTP